MLTSNKKKGQSEKKTITTKTGEKKTKKKHTREIRRAKDNSTGKCIRQTKPARRLHEETTTEQWTKKTGKWTFHSFSDALNRVFALPNALWHGSRFAKCPRAQVLLYLILPFFLQFPKQSSCFTWYIRAQ